MKRSATIGTILAAAFLFGCVAHNERNAVGDAYTPAMFARSDFALKPEAAKPDGPSLTGMSRENWSLEPFIVPMDGVAHRPFYADNSAGFDRLARQRGDYPTALSAVDGAGATYWPMMGEAFLSPVYAAGGLLMMPYRMAKEAPWAGPARATPQMYWRAPISESRRSEPRPLLLADPDATTEGSTK